MSDTPANDDQPCRPPGLDGKRVRLIGRFASVSQQEAAAAVERRGGVLDGREPDWVVVGEDATEADRQSAHAAAEATGAECLDECELWSRLGLVDESQGVSRLYSPAMLGELVGAPLAAIRRWSRRGVLRPVRRVNRLDYFDFGEARVATLLSELLACRRSLPAVDLIIDRLAAAFPDQDRPLAELPLVVVDGELLLRSSDQLTETSGQRCFDFEEPPSERAEEGEEEAPIVLRLPEATPQRPGTLRERAWELCDDGRLDEAIEAWRLVLLESFPTADDHFTLAEWLYRGGRLEAARERYYGSLELDNEHLEARVSLGCVLIDLGDVELAIAALHGAIEQHEGFADAHYHLARAYSGVGDAESADPHWRRFLEIAPEGPWADEAKQRLGLSV